MVESNILILELASMVFFVATTGLILLMILTKFRGMRKPPFWIYLFGGFLLITFHGVLTVVDTPLIPKNPLILAAIRLAGNLAVFFGIYRMYKTQTSSIKFDKAIDN